ncbi:MAG: CDP-alcohol phosphatidyltransferase family protein [Sulfuricurvum sp.]|jgi:CDP-diacylglycerol--serine O-phosphatidyltransferase|nr:CDP-alcohol phosphatidyltransferase family protein [Sulfuricurvum sp.]
MHFLWRSESHFNLANLFTMANITCGLLATYFVTQHQFVYAVILAWMGGAFDIFDGKIARKYALSNEFGVQLDSFADFLSFVLVPTFFIFEGVYAQLSGFPLILASIASIYYVISGLRRLIQFNINTDAGEVSKYFTGVPTPLGAILLWLVWLGSGFIGWMGVLALMLLIGALLNSKVKIPHL